MGYLNENGLARYDGLIKNWVTLESGTVDGVDALLNWQKTSNASTVSFYPLPAAPLDPVVTFAFTETDPAEGTKTSDNPSTITGVSSITVTRCETIGVDETQYIIDLGDTYYGGSVNLNSGIMTVTHVYKTLTSNNVGVFSVADSCVGCRVNIGPDLIYAGTKITDKFAFNASGNATSEHFRALSGPLYNTIVLYVSKTRLDFSGAVDPSNPTDEEMRAAFKVWIDENPVNFCGELAVPYTVQLTPTQIYSLSQIDPYTPRINTVYSDQASVQVGYPKSPLATSAELTNVIVSLGGNI